MQPTNPMTALCVGGVLLFVLSIIGVCVVIAAVNVVFVLVLARAAPMARREWRRRLQPRPLSDAARDDRTLADAEREQRLALDVQREIEAALNGLL